MQVKERESKCECTISSGQTESKQELNTNKQLGRRHSLRLERLQVAAMTSISNPFKVYILNYNAHTSVTSIANQLTRAPAAVIHHMFAKRYLMIFIHREHIHSFSSFCSIIEKARSERRSSWFEESLQAGYRSLWSALN